MQEQTIKGAYMRVHATFDHRQKLKPYSFIEIFMGMFHANINCYLRPNCMTLTPNFGLVIRGYEVLDRSVVVDYINIYASRERPDKRLIIHGPKAHIKLSYMLAEMLQRVQRACMKRNGAAALILKINAQLPTLISNLVKIHLSWRSDLILAQIWASLGPKVTDHISDHISLHDAIYTFVVSWSAKPTNQWIGFGPQPHKFIC